MIMQAKNILIISLEFPPDKGGIASYVDALATTLSKTHSVTVLAPLVPKEESSPEKTYPYTLIRTPFFFPAYIWPSWLRLAWFVYTYAKQHQVDVIMLHHLLPEGYVARIMQKIHHIPYFIFSHGTDIVAAQSSARKKRLASMVGDNAQAIIANSESLQERIIRAFPSFHGKVHVMYPSVDERFLQPVDQEVVSQLRSQYGLEGKKVILTIARLVKEKGIHELIDLMPKVLEQEPHTVWFLIGDGPEQQAVLQHMQDVGLHHSVRYVGAIAHEQLPLFYQLADLFVLLSVPYQGREEGLGLVFLEAAGAQLPIVAGRSGGVSEAVAHEYTGYVYDVATKSDSIIDAIVLLLQDKDQADRFARAGKKRIVEQFRWSKQIDILNTLLENIDT